MTAETIARELHGRRSGAGWMAKCPAHEDRSPSLSITERDGKTLLHCFTGCPQDAVISALRARGLWPERERPQWTPAERRDWGRRRRQAETEAQRCLWWFEALLSSLEFEKAVAADQGDLNRLSATAPELFRLRSLNPSELLAEYRRRLVEDYAEAEALIASGRAVQRAIEDVGHLILAKWQRDSEINDAAAA